MNLNSTLKTLVAGFLVVMVSACAGTIGRQDERRGDMVNAEEGIQDVTRIAEKRLARLNAVNTCPVGTVRTNWKPSGYASSDFRASNTGDTWYAKVGSDQSHDCRVLAIAEKAALRDASYDPKSLEGSALEEALEIVWMDGTVDEYAAN